jgi:hypothetical protein
MSSASLPNQPNITNSNEDIYVETVQNSWFWFSIILVFIVIVLLYIIFVIYGVGIDPKECSNCFCHFSRKA